MACEYELSPARQGFLLVGGAGTCTVRTSSDCRWSAAADGWITVTAGGNGRGNGTIVFVVQANTGPARNGRIRLNEEGGGRCEIEQAGVLLAAPALPSVTSWSSHLDVPGASGQIVVDGAVQPGSKAARARARLLGHGRHRLEGTVIAGSSRPGVWRFELTGIRPGSLQIEAGTVASLTAQAVAFRLEGQPGERIAFAFETSP